MNRISTLVVPASPKKQPAAVLQIEQSILSRREHQGQPHAVFAPLHYEPNYAYPLVIWLHGQAGDERQLQKIMPLVSMRNYVAIGVRGPCESPLGRGYFWPQRDDAAQFAQQRVFDAIDLATERYSINRDRIFVAGYQCGGTTALRVALANPRMFSGAISIGGRFPQGQSPLAQLPHLRKLPMLIAHCRDSQTYSIDDVCEELSLFHSASLKVTLRQYPCGDELTTQMLHDADVWMMERVTGMPATEADTCELPSDCN